MRSSRVPLFGPKRLAGVGPKRGKEEGLTVANKHNASLHHVRHFELLEDVAGYHSL